jgi:hypothetical protein
MKTSIYLTAIAFSIVSLSACTSYNYYTAAINKSNLTAYHSFAWMPQANGGSKAFNGDMADVKIKDGVTQSLVSKGLQLNQKNPDLIVNYTLKVGQGSRTSYYSPYYGGYPGWGWGLGWRWGWAYRPYYYYGYPFAYDGGVTYAEKEHYKEGTLIIDLVDARTHKIVWRGFGVGEVHKNPQKNTDDLPKVVDGVLSQLQVYAQPAVKKS